MKDPNFSGYSAKTPGESLGARARLRQLKRQVIYGGVLLPYGMLKHRKLIRTCDRIDDHTYTCFFRAPAQLQALTGPVLDHLGRPERRGQRLEILTLACSNGAEVYTMASWLSKTLPNLDFHITGSDLHEEMVDRCRQASYSEAEALQSEYIEKDFVDSTFDKQGDRYVVKAHLRERTTFKQGDLLDGPGLRASFPPADIVTAQNVLFHLEPKDCRVAFGNIVSLAKPKGVFLLEGMELDLRVELTKKYGLTPLLYDLRRIYSETRVHTPPEWWKYYWGTEPYLPFRTDKARRYGTIFFKD